MITSRAGARNPKSICYSAVAALIFFAVQPVTAQANWIDWTTLNEVNFPTRINGIYFPTSKLTIDADHRMKWGSWIVSFAAVRPTARYKRISSLAAPYFESRVEIVLRCENPVDGSNDCTMSLEHIISYDKEVLNRCAVETMGADSVKFAIDCPSHLLLDDQKRRTRR
ncbi:hypothetical protein [Bradyrhizobium sp. HKCCYLRH3061]|uniref:hypothetical protein n=1 Tax=Bradyrhizobium sp. HKCCYLRH3061 TaxID=3420734 RepID=UPI003EBA1111